MAMGIDRLSHVRTILLTGERLAEYGLLLVCEGPIAHSGVGGDVDVGPLDHSYGELVELLLLLVLVLVLKAALIVAAVASVREVELLLLLLLLEAVGAALEVVALVVVVAVAGSAAHAVHAIHSHAHAAGVEAAVAVVSVRLLSVVGILLLEGLSVVHVLAGRGTIGVLDLDLLLMLLVLH